MLSPLSPLALSFIFTRLTSIETFQIITLSPHIRNSLEGVLGVDVVVGVGRDDEEEEEEEAAVGVFGVADLGFGVPLVGVEAEERDLGVVLGVVEPGFGVEVLPGVL